MTFRSGLSSLLDRSRHVFSSFSTRTGDVVNGPVDEFEDLADDTWGRMVGGLRLGGDGSAWRSILFWLIIVVVILLFAAVTNPSESSLRNHLTALSFGRHVAGIRSSDESTSDDLPQPVPPDKDKQPPDRIEGVTPFRFANHVAISLRTPTLSYKTLFFFSFAFTSPLAPPVFLSEYTGIKGKGVNSIPRDRIVVFFGFMGQWSMIGMVPRNAEWVWRLVMLESREKGRKKNLDRAGVIDVRAVASQDVGSSPAKPSPNTQPLPPSKLRHSDSGSNLNETATLPLHAPPPTLPIPPGSRRPSIVNLVPTPQPPEVVESNPLIVALVADLTNAQSALTDLETQLLQQESSTAEELQTTLDQLRARRKADDSERAEMKSKSKTLEESKRQAESSRRDAEKKLKAVEVVRDGVQAKIAAAVSEMESLRGNMETSEKSVQNVQQEGAKHVIDIKEAVDEKKREVEELEAELGELETRGNDLANQVKEAEERLRQVHENPEAGKKMAPEEEMLMMAQMYEAAAQEGYLHGQQQQAYQNQWANQAAAYMAEAGMPYLDQNYTARPTQSGFGHLSQSTRDKRTDAGYEDFGPSTQTFNRPATPPAGSDTESEIFHDFGSPHGVGTNLLPQGLFSSLDGDTTESGSVDMDDEPVTLATALNESRNTNGHDHESGSESSDEHQWPSPRLRKDSMSISTSNATSVSDVRTRRFSASHSQSRFLAPNDSSPTSIHGVPLNIPGLPGSRRWFSSSNENVSSFAFLHPTTSNDSLNLPYEASPFAPSASEKKALALKWPLSKRWPGTGRDTLPSLTANWLPFRHPDKETNPYGEISLVGNVNGNGTASSSSSFNLRVPPTHPEITLNGEEEDEKAVGAVDKKPFRFFSLRKSSNAPTPGTGTSPNE